ncbi:dihydrofolate reductase [Nitratireductor thuwali]|uniref:Dihydrofolate reductase n=1 Tax=Nitratireductor thuwali TaxID=2267699 RepID=A0ABY5MG23_9HYPH|nr:Dihydrofolate reductase type 3 [Nitratireductor thuwali]
MDIALVVAMAENGVIGREGGLPWRLSTDLKRFKAVTMGKPVIMGRKTWESIGRPLPGRLNIVISRDPAYVAEGAEVVPSLDAGLALAEERAAGADEICVIGGGEIFREALEHSDRLYVTHVLADVTGDAHFPPIDSTHWEAVSTEDVPAGEKDVYPTRYVVYQRCR